MPESQRIASLDILRGLTVVGMIVVNAAAGLQRYPVPLPLLHSHWIGLTLADLVFPVFIFLVGVSIAVSMPGAAIVPVRSVSRRILARASRLILLGIFLTNIYWLADYEANTFRWAGVLQRIGLVYLIVAPLHLLLSIRALIAVTFSILLGYSALCFLPVPDAIAVDLHVAGSNIVSWFDRFVLGTHLYVQGPLGYDPEGLLSTLPAIAQGLLGVIAGRSLGQQSNMRTFVVCGVGCIAGGLAWSLVIPISKDMWSPSFVLVTSGMALLLLIGLRELVDVRGTKLWGATLWTAFGVNAIAAYVLHYVTADVLGWKSFDAAYAIAAAVVGPHFALAVPIGLFLAFISWAMLTLQRRGWKINI